MSLFANEAHAGLVTAAMEARARLVQILPQAVDRLTPEGTVPAGGLLSQAAGLLRGLR